MAFYENTQDYDPFNEEESEDVVFTSKPIDSSDALILSLNEKACVDLYYMSRISGITFQQLIDELDIYPDPEEYIRTDYEHCFVIRSQLFAGNTVKKYELAKQEQERTGLFAKTIEVLEEACPEMIDAREINPSISDPMIPPIVKAKCIQEMFDKLPLPPKIEYDSFQGITNIEFPVEPGYVFNKCTYGTERAPAVKIIKARLKKKPIVVNDYVSESGKKSMKSVRNEAETLLALEKVALQDEAFSKILYSNEDYKKIYEEVHYHKFGYSVNKNDGSWLRLEDLNKDVHPYDHQKDGIAKMMLNKSVGIFDNVGAGKTLVFIVGAHELTRIGLVKKVLIVVPNNRFQATYDTYKLCYPNDRIFAVYRNKDFIPAKRDQTLEKIKSDEYQVIIMAYSSFDMITVSSDWVICDLEHQMDECLRAIHNAKLYTTRQSLKSKYKRLKKELQKAKEKYLGLDDPNTACFEELGIDMLIVDEAHNYKNISIEKNSDNIIGFHSKGSQKADDMLRKVECVRDKGGRICFLTGTPITNSLSDIYVLQRYLQPNDLRMCNLYHFNEWTNAFVSNKSNYEVDVDGSNGRSITRGATFNKLPELQSMFSNVSSFNKIDDNVIDLPEFDGYTDIKIKMSKALREHIDALSERTDMIRSHMVERKEDNLLKITVEGRLGALDMRLIDSDAEVSEKESKVWACAQNIHKLYWDHPDTGQIIFCDSSTPKKGFNIYDELKRILVSKGIPEGEVAFIHDATNDKKRTELEKAFNKGRIRILIGSTMKLGIGCNVQERLIAIHHLDVPWRPADMVQREGRIIRQGNTCEKVYIFRYVTEGSFDAYSWQILENKQRFIAQFLEGTLSVVHREETDCSDTILSYAEIKALCIGNPLIKRRFELANDIEQAKMKQREKRKELNRLSEAATVTIPQKIFALKGLYISEKKDAAYYKSVNETVSMEERNAFGEELLEELGKCNIKSQERLFDTYKGFGIYLPDSMDMEKPYIIVRRKDSIAYTIKIDKEITPIGCSKKIDHLLEHLDQRAEDHMKDIQDLTRQRNRAEADLEKGNEYDAIVKQLTNELSLVDRKLEEGMKV